MPYNSAQATKGITVLTRTITYSVSPNPPWTAGQSVTFTAVVKEDGTPVVGILVHFEGTAAGVTEEFAREYTDATGKAQKTVTIPWMIGTFEIPCRTWDTYARADTLKSTIIKAAIAYPTRISISAPDTVSPGQTFAISGKLEYQIDSATWAPASGRTVSLYYNGTLIGNVTTGTDGSYSKPDAAISTPGTYTLKASYAGEGFAAAAAFLGLTVSPEVKAALQVALPLLTGAIVAFVSLKAKR
jgi:hypothetical protein